MIAWTDTTDTTVTGAVAKLYDNTRDLTIWVMEKSPGQYTLENMGAGTKAGPFDSLEVAKATAVILFDEIVRMI